MTQSPVLRGLLLLLLLQLLMLLLSQFWMPKEAGDQKVVVLMPPEVNGSRGETVTLPCNLQPVESEIQRVKQIRWKRLDPRGDPSTVAEYDWEQGPNIPHPDHVQFVAAGKDKDLLDASLTLTDLQPHDEAIYTCEVTTFQHGSGRASTWLRVFYAPLVSISQLDEIGQQGHREISLSCYADSKPEHSGYEWSTTTGSLPPSAVPQGAQLLLQSSEESMDITFICRVSNALGMGQATLRVLLPGSSRSLSALTIGLIVALMVMVMVVLIFCVIYCYGFYEDSSLSKENESFLHRPQERHSLLGSCKD